MPKRRPTKTRAIVKIFWRHTKKYPVIFALAVLGGVVAQAAHVIGPLFIRDLFNLLATPPSSTTQLAFLVPIAFYTLVSLIGWAGGRLEMWLGYTIIAKVMADLTKEAFRNLIRHSYQFFSSSFAGALTRRVGRFSNAYENLYYSIVTQVFQAFLYVVGVSGVLFYRNWVLGAIVIFWVILFITLQWWLARWQQPLRLARAEEDSKVTATLADSISNQNTITLFAGSSYEEKIVGTAADRFRAAQLHSWNLNALIYGIQGLLAIALNVGMLWVGVLYWQQGLLTIGDLVLIQAYVFGLFDYVWNLGRQFHIIYTSLADASEMVEILETPFGVKNAPDAKEFKIKSGELWFDDISFYFNEGRAVLKNFNLMIKPGEKIALVGPSGAGKTTLTKLLLRLYDVQSGRIMIDRQNIAEVTQDSLRETVAFVPQEPILFHRTLKENIRYGRRNASDEEVIEAAKKANCHDFISALPLKYETLVGERGIRLSGGERQRVAIARAILKNAPILVLDEATSSLDSESEALIQDALAVLMQGKTVIVIAHRLSTIMKMDRIVVLENGKSVAEGTHEELLNHGGLYHKLWSIQAGGFIVDKDEFAEEEKEA
ncbi:MAG: ATP-binding cassette, subfamily B, bacterial [Parcubacteria group bacterium Gr01-1014_56]|nr:MAG: ATP-binding cassette, subfamily B, bacterial [Parcubacteria group bacterium Gr01-1014_56]